MTFSPPSDDPFGYREDLMESLAHPGFDESATSEAREDAAVSLCQALGCCRLFGVSVDDSVDGAVPPDIARSAAAAMFNRLELWTSDANDLSNRWDETADPNEADDLCGGMLQLRMNVWAVWIAIDESYQVWLDAQPDGDDFDSVLDQFMGGIERFDTALRGQVRLLSTVADLHLLDNWRAELAEPYRECLPWWLDGTLEDAFRQLSESAAAGLPDKASWQTLANQVHVKRAPPVLNFRHSGAFELAAAGPRSKLVLEDQGVELWLLGHARNDLLCLQIKSDLAVEVEEVLVGGSRLALVEDWDEDLEAVVRKQDVMPALASGREIQIRVRAAGSA